LGCVASYCASNITRGVVGLEGRRNIFGRLVHDRQFSVLLIRGRRRAHENCGTTGGRGRRGRWICALASIQHCYCRPADRHYFRSGTKLPNVDGRGSVAIGRHTGHDTNRPIRSRLIPLANLIVPAVDVGASRSSGHRASSPRSSCIATPLAPRPALENNLLSPAAGAQAARTESRNLVISTFKRVLSLDSICAADRTCEEAEPVSPAPSWTSVMLQETC
jgi:hypothetical protein